MEWRHKQHHKAQRVKDRIKKSANHPRATNTSFTRDWKSKATSLELSHSFRMTATGRPLQPHQLSSIYPMLSSWILCSSAFQLFSARCTAFTGSKQEWRTSLTVSKAFVLTAFEDTDVDRKCALWKKPWSSRGKAFLLLFSSHHWWKWLSILGCNSTPSVWLLK